MVSNSTFLKVLSNIKMIFRVNFHNGLKYQMSNEKYAFLLLFSIYESAHQSLVVIALSSKGSGEPRLARAFTARMQLRWIRQTC